MPTSRLGIAVLLFLLVQGPECPFHSPAWADPPEKPAAPAKPPPAEAGKPSFFQEVKKGLKGLETRIPAETSKAAKATKEGFKKRFKTTHEEQKQK